jgi:hypothetical protein
MQHTLALAEQLASAARCSVSQEAIIQPPTNEGHGGAAADPGPAVTKMRVRQECSMRMPSDYPAERLSALCWCRQPAKRLGGLFGRAKAATQDAAEDARDAVEKAPRKPLFGGLGRGKPKVGRMRCALLSRNALCLPRAMAQLLVCCRERLWYSRQPHMSWRTTCQMGCLLGCVSCQAPVIRKHGSCCTVLARPIRGAAAPRPWENLLGGRGMRRMHAPEP